VRIGFRDVAADAVADGGQSGGIRSGRSWNSRWAVEFETGIVADLLDAVTQVHAVQPETAARAIEGKQPQSGEQCPGAARPIYAAFACSRSADEIHFRHHDPARVLLAKQDDARHQEVQVRRAERTRPAHRRNRIVAGAHQIDVGLAVDLPAAEEERVDPALRGQVEELDAAAREKIVFLRTEHGHAHRDFGLRTCKQGARAGYRRRCADRYMGASLQQACADRDEQLGPAECAHAAACTPPSHSARNCATPSAPRASVM
jgi:hypothetical protein